MNDRTTDRRKFLKGAAGASALVAAQGANAALPAASQQLVARTSMPTRTLGKTGEQVPIMHLGTSQRLNPQYDKVMHRSFKSGVTWFDTALSYGWGSSHDAIKNFVSQMGDRSKLWLTSKSGARDPEGLIEGASEALTGLGTNYLDLFLMHGIRSVSMLDAEYLKVGDRLKKEGKTRLFGFSCVTVMSWNYSTAQRNAAASTSSYFATTFTVMTTSN